MNPMTIEECRRLGLLPAAESKKQGSNAAGWGQDGILTLRLPKLDKATHPNSRIHWGAKAEATAAQKEASKAIATATMIGKPWKAATVQVTYYTCATRCDRDNILSWCKAVFDGLQGVVIEDDSAFTYLPVQIQKVKRTDAMQGRVDLLITKTA